MQKSSGSIGVDCYESLIYVLKETELIAELIFHDESIHDRNAWAPIFAHDYQHGLKNVTL